MDVLYYDRPNISPPMIRDVDVKVNEEDVLHHWDTSDDDEAYKVDSVDECY